MPALLHKLNYTYADYLGFEASSNVRHEFLDGQIYAMAGGTPVEVLSRSTEEYDSGDKFEHYKSFPSLREYVLVSHRQRSVEIRSREGEGWRTTLVPEGGIAELSICGRLDVRELHDAAAEPST